MKRVIMSSLAVSLLMYSCTKEADILEIAGQSNDEASATLVGSPEPQSLLTLAGNGNPGHYVSLEGNHASQADMTAIAAHVDSGVVGVQKRWMWSEIETSKDGYYFDGIISDLNHADSLGLKFIVFIVDKTFDSTKHPVPNYIRNGFEAPNNPGGYSGARWKSYYRTRWDSLITALSGAIGTHSALEGIAFQETALGLLNGERGVDIDDDPNNDCNCVAGTYDVNLYAYRLTQMLQHASAEFSQKRVFWYMNFVQGDYNNIKIRQIAEELKDIPGKNVLMGGPDILPNRWSLTDRVYPIYDEFEGQLTLFCSAQWDSYEHPKTGNDPINTPCTNPPYMTPWQIFFYAKDELHVNYVMWNYKTWSGCPGSYNIYNAYNVIAANPAFNQYN